MQVNLHFPQCVVAPLSHCVQAVHNMKSKNKVFNQQQSASNYDIAPVVLVELSKRILANDFIT